MQRVGSRAQVMHGNAKMTGGGLKKKDLKYNKQGKIVSKKMSAMVKKEKRLQKAGYTTKKGQFGAVRVMRGGGIDVSGEYITFNQEEILEKITIKHNDHSVITILRPKFKRGRNRRLVFLKLNRNIGDITEETIIKVFDLWHDNTKYGLTYKPCRSADGEPCSRWSTGIKLRFLHLTPDILHLTPDIRRIESFEEGFYDENEVQSIQIFEPPNNNPLFT